MIKTEDHTNNCHRYAVVVAGGAGTRLWPLSRKNLPKQMQKFVSDKTLIDETVDRLKGLIPVENIFVSTTKNYAPKIKELLPELRDENIIIEPVARGTTVAFALFTQMIHALDSEAVIFTLASDHAVTDINRFQATLDQTYAFVEKHPSNIALVGIKPNQPDTGMGYIKADALIQENPQVFSVEKFVEKPSLGVAKRYLESGEYYWNAAYYCFRASTLIEAYAEADVEIVKWTGVYIKSNNLDDFMKAPEKAHEIETINTRKYPLALIPADFSWSDIGNWHSLYELLADIKGTSDVSFMEDIENHINVDSANCLVFSTDKRIVATVGLKDVVVVSTNDALLVMSRSESQQIKQVIQKLKDKGLNEYL